tara:strand:- start:420 stop:716 length:297 start_codon:yes stop_codon:yes gene_type:complete
MDGKIKDIIENEMDCLITDVDFVIKKEGNLQTLVNMLEEAINYTRCCTELKDKKITDLLNWVKSDLAQETNVKLGKTVTPYRTEKLKFLNKLLEIENL